MTEYIFDVPDSNQPIADEFALYYPDERDEPMAVGEEIVRCGDCFERIQRTGLKRTGSELTEYEYGWCRAHHLCVDSHHFCAWGARADE